MPRLPSPSVLALALAATCFAAPAAAQEAQAGAAAAGETDEAARQEARALFGEGVDFADRGEWDAAVEKFRAAIDLVDVPSVRFNLASALYEAGRFVEASVEIDHLLEAPDTPEEVRGYATELRDTLREAAGRLTVNVEAAEGVEVRVDDEVLPPSRYGRTVPVRPGERVVRAVVAREVVELVAGQTTTVDLDLGGAPSVHGSGLKDWRIWAIVSAILGATTIALIGVVAAN